MKRKRKGEKECWNFFGFHRFSESGLLWLLSGGELLHNTENHMWFLLGAAEGPVLFRGVVTQTSVGPISSLRHRWTLLTPLTTNTV